MKETLTYLRVAREAKDGANGVLYLHKWYTGHQELIFPHHEAAKQYEKRVNVQASIKSQS